MPGPAGPIAGRLHHPSRPHPQRQANSPDDWTCCSLLRGLVLGCWRPTGPPSIVMTRYRRLYQPEGDARCARAGVALFGFLVRAGRGRLLAAGSRNKGPLDRRDRHRAYRAVTRQGTEGACDVGAATAGVTTRKPRGPSPRDDHTVHRSSNAPEHAGFWSAGLEDLSDRQ
jgi:hypothetical protein